MTPEEESVEREQLLLDLLNNAKEGDAQAAIRVSDLLRSRGANYKRVAEYARANAGIGAQEWEALLYDGEDEADPEESYYR